MEEEGVDEGDKDEGVCDPGEGGEFAPVQGLWGVHCVGFIHKIRRRETGGGRVRTMSTVPFFQFQTSSWLSLPLPLPEKRMPRRSLQTWMANVKPTPSAACVTSVGLAAFGCGLLSSIDMRCIL